MWRLVPYSHLLITAIILDRVVISSTQIGAQQSLRSLIFLLLLNSLAILLIQYHTKDLHYTNFIALLPWLMLLLYRYVYRLIKIHLPHWSDQSAFILLLLLCILYIFIIKKRLWQSIRNPARMTYYFSVVFALLVSFQIVRLAQDIYRSFMSRTYSQTTVISESTDGLYLKSGIDPDIYVIVLDGYSRQDVLMDLYNFDNSKFIGQLEKMGFFVANESHSNYIQTPYAMASFWNFDYLQPWNSSCDYAQYLLRPIQNNRVFRLLDDIGYTTVSFEGEVDYIEIKNCDRYLSNFLPLNKFESLLLVDSPLEPFTNSFNLEIPIPSYKTHSQRILFNLHTLKDIPTSIPGPKIIYAHIVTPHPPFVFTKNGSAVRMEQPFSLLDDSTYKGGPGEYRNGYVEQLIFINSEIMDMINNILTESETQPIVILMSDHGPASKFDWNQYAPGCLWERTSNFYAVLLPGHQADKIMYPSITPVNTFRVIFNTYFDTNLPLLEDQSFMMSWQQPTMNMDITNMRDLHDGCAIDD